MPEKGWKSVTLRESVLVRLAKFAREAKASSPNEAIVFLLNEHELAELNKRQQVVVTK